jgi:hypothetical protein
MLNRIDSSILVSRYVIKVIKSLVVETWSLAYLKTIFKVTTCDDITHKRDDDDRRLSTRLAIMTKASATQSHSIPQQRPSAVSPMKAVHIVVQRCRSCKVLLQEIELCDNSGLFSSCVELTSSCRVVGIELCD